MERRRVYWKRHQRTIPIFTRVNPLNMAFLNLPTMDCRFFLKTKPSHFHFQEGLLEAPPADNSHFHKSKHFRGDLPSQRVLLAPQDYSYFLKIKPFHFHFTFTFRRVYWKHQRTIPIFTRANTFKKVSPPPPPPPLPPHLLQSHSSPPPPPQ